MKVADVKLKWTRSPNSDVTSRKLNVTINGETNSYDVGPEVSEYMIEVQALGTVQFNTTIFDNEGNEVSSETATFSP